MPSSSIVVQWFRTIQTNPLKGKYAPKIVVCPKKKRARKNTKNQPQLDVLDLGEVDILVYDFQLTNDATMHMFTFF